MLKKVLKTCNYVVKNATHVKINYDKADELAEELLSFSSVHYLTKLPYDIYSMPTKDIINFLLIYDAIDFSFWGNPKWTIEANGKQLDGAIALLHCIFNLFNNRNSEDVYQELELMPLEQFRELLKGNVDIPLLEERYHIIHHLAKVVNGKMNGDFYGYIKGISTDNDIFKILLDNFSNFIDIRKYKGQIIYFYKLAQLLTSDILHVIQSKENKVVDYSHLVGCADYKIPQVMQTFGILEYDDKLMALIESKTPIEENSELEVEIRAAMIAVIDHIYNKSNGRVSRIDINDFVWSKSQDKLVNFKPYHLTRTTSY
jgi:hypothetical protein